MLTRKAGGGPEAGGAAGAELVTRVPAPGLTSCMASGSRIHVLSLSFPIYKALPNSATYKD